MKLSTSFSKSITSSGSESEHEADFSLPFSFIQERLLLCDFSATTERAAAVVVGAEAAGVVADAEAETAATGSVSEAEAAAVGITESGIDASEAEEAAAAATSGLGLVAGGGGAEEADG